MCVYMLLYRTIIIEEEVMNCRRSGRGPGRVGKEAGGECDIITVMYKILRFYMRIFFCLLFH